MSRFFLTICMPLVFTTTAWAVPMGDAEAVAAVMQLERDGRPAYELVNLLVDDGRSVEDATVLVVRVGNETTRAAATLAGMCLAGRLEEFAGSVGNAVYAIAPEDDAVVNTISTFSFEKCETFLKGLPYPQGVGAPEPRGPGVPVSPSS
ncbi:hypothetical protein GCM10007052_32340 [Halioglobus japonicus]|nr:MULTISPECIES: hypothetical protein [Halioglobus]GHD21499.1 hypothetical protein GCM10007052_32340 [Halioglobus japonicus]